MKRKLMIGLWMILLFSLAVMAQSECSECVAIDNAWDKVKVKLKLPPGQNFYDPILGKWVPASRYLTGVIQGEFVLREAGVKRFLDGILPGAQTLQQKGCILGGIEQRTWERRSVGGLEWSPTPAWTFFDSEGLAAVIVDRITNKGQKLILPGEKKDYDNNDVYREGCIYSVLQAMEPGMKVIVNGVTFEKSQEVKDGNVTSIFISLNQARNLNEMTTDIINLGRDVEINPEYIEPEKLELIIFSPRDGEVTGLAVEFRADARGGKPPYEFKWVGPAIGSGVIGPGVVTNIEGRWSQTFGTQPKFNESDGVQFTLTVTDSNMDTASDSLTFSPRTRNSYELILYDGSSLPVTMWDKKFKFIDGKWKWTYTDSDDFKPLINKSVTGRINLADLREVLSDKQRMIAGIRWWDGIFNLMEQLETSYVDGIEVLVLAANDNKNNPGVSDPELLLKRPDRDYTYECCEIDLATIERAARKD
ncbi:MAG: hypothetical protein KAT77_04460 [Nanoarchaeota archaeon]|nr:hypothetical protein [Nanoarchaeota archaeon]